MVAIAVQQASGSLENMHENALFTWFVHSELVSLTQLINGLVAPGHELE